MGRVGVRLTDSDRNLAAFVATLATIIVLSRFGGNGADLAILTALVAVLGMLGQNFRKSIPPEKKDAP